MQCHRLRKRRPPLGTKIALLTNENLFSNGTPDFWRMARAGVAVDARSDAPGRAQSGTRPRPAQNASFDERAPGTQPRADRADRCVRI